MTKTNILPEYLIVSGIFSITMEDCYVLLYLSDSKRYHDTTCKVYIGSGALNYVYMPLYLLDTDIRRPQ